MAQDILVGPLTQRLTGGGGDYLDTAEPVPSNSGKPAIGEDRGWGWGGSRECVDLGCN